MYNPIQKLRQSSVVFEKLGIFSRKLKSSNCLRVEYFLLNFAHGPYTHCLQKGVRDCFLFGLDLELFEKIQNNLVSTQSLKLFSLISKIKIIPKTYSQAFLSRTRV